MLKKCGLNYSVIIKMLLVFAFAVGILNLSHHYLNSDEGVILNGVWKMYQGEKIYEDFFEYVAPGSFYFIWGVFKIFAPSYFVAAFFSILFLLGSTFFLYLASLKIVNNRLSAMLVSALWILALGFVPLINHNTYSSLIAVIFTCLFLEFLNTKKRKFAFLAGLTAVLVFYFLQTKGVVVFLSGLFMFGFYYKYFKHGLLLYLSGAGLVALVGWLWWVDYIYSNMLLVSSSYVGLHEHFYHQISYLILPILAVLFWAIKNYRNNQSIVFLVILQLGLLSSTINLPDHAHIITVSFPSIIIGAYFLEKYLLHAGNKKATRNILALVFLFLIFMTFAFKGLPFDREVAQGIASLKNELEDKKVYARPFLPGIYFELEKQNPYFSSTFETEVSSTEILEKNYQRLLDEAPEVVLTNYSAVRKYGYKYNKIDEYIFENYNLVKELGDVAFWEKIIITN